MMIKSPLPATELTLAIPRGSLYSPTLDLLTEAGFGVDELRGNDRKLVFEVGEGRTMITARPTDVPAYVEYGAADVGIVGKDVLLEQRRDLYELIDLGYGHCRIIFATQDKGRLPGKGRGQHGVMRVASKYPRITREYFASLGRQVEIIELRGSIELSPQVDLADGIVDLTSSGETMRQNNLEEQAEIASCSARLVANRVSFKLKAEMIDKLVDRLVEVTGDRHT